MEILFSPGAAHNPVEVVPPQKNHTLPIKPRVPVHKQGAEAGCRHGSPCPCRLWAPRPPGARHARCPITTHARAHPLTEAFDGEKAGVTLNHLESMLKPYAKPFKRQSVRGLVRDWAAHDCCKPGLHHRAPHVHAHVHTGFSHTPTRRSRTPCGATSSTHRRRSWTSGCNRNGHVCSGIGAPMHSAATGRARGGRRLGAARSYLLAPPPRPGPRRGLPVVTAAILRQVDKGSVRRSPAAQPRRTGLWPFRPRPTCRTAVRGASTASCTRSPQR